MVLPSRWRKTAPRWHEVSELVYQDIVDGALKNKWEIASLPTVGVVVEVSPSTSSVWMYWRELDVNGDIVAGGAFPPWMVVSITL